MLPMTRGSFIFASAITSGRLAPSRHPTGIGTKIEAFAEAYAPS